MRIDSARLRAAALALLRLLVFAAAFLALYLLLTEGLGALVHAESIALDAAVLLASAVIGGVVLYRLLEKRPAATLGFPLTRRAAPQFLLGGALGVVALLAACALLVAVGALRYRGDAGSLQQWLSGMIVMLFVLLIPAAAEEALFRGYAFQKLVEGFGAVLATVGVSVAFAAAHANNPSVNAFALVNIFAAGVMLSVAFLRTRSLWFATGVHVGWNWSMAALLDLPVSGLELFDAPLYEPVERGPAWLSGGAFGPEAGLAGLIGLSLALYGVIWLTRNREWLT